MSIKPREYRLKKHLNKKQIFDAVSAIASSGNIPNLRKIREYLGSGSKVTIHKYFQQWKQECLKNFSGLDKILSLIHISQGIVR